MPGSLQDAIKEAYATARSDVVYLDTFEIVNPSIEPLYIVRDRVDHTLKLETNEWKLFVATAFRFVLPAAGDNGVQDLSIAIDNVDLRASDFVKSVVGSNAPVEMRYRPYLSTDLETPQMNPPLILYLTDIQVTAFEVSGRASFAEVLNRGFLTELYTRKRFPTLGS